MAKHCSFVAENVTPISQNNRNTASLTRLRTDLTRCHDLKYPTRALPYVPLLDSDLQVKLFYIHRVPDYKDADNLSKPLWDSLNAHAYKDDKHIRYLETLKIRTNTPDIFELDITNIEIPDLEKLIDFMDASSTKERLLYISIDDYECKSVRF